MDLGSLFETSPFSPPGGMYDMVVVGGGSGGIAAAREAASLGASVALVDYVRPSEKGTSWGIGGTCVNVGCIPKKLMHYASDLGRQRRAAVAFGWEEAREKHDWNVLRDGVASYIHSMNFGYRSALSEEGVVVVEGEGRGRVVEGGVEVVRDDGGIVGVLPAKEIVVGVGGRPRGLDGVESGLMLTSDDIFSLPSLPKKVVVLGAGYVGLELGGFLAGLGCDVSIVVRSKVLRGFDEDVVGKVVEDMEKVGVEFVVGKGVETVRRNEKGNGVEVVLEGGEIVGGDEVVNAIGRDAELHGLGLDSVGVEVDERSGKVVGGGVGGNGRSSVATSLTNPHIHVVGDCLQGYPELTPVAIATGKHLSRTLFSPTPPPPLYPSPHLPLPTSPPHLIPTAVFTPLEMAVVGVSEQEARNMWDDGRMVEVYHLEYNVLEESIGGKEGERCYFKLVTVEDDGGEERVVGIHIAGPHASEIIQGFTVAMQLGVTKQQLESTIPIHPTHAEDLINANKTKSSGISPKKTSC